jgi:exosortase O
VIAARGGASLALLALWFWFYRPVYPYLGTIFTRQEFRTNQIVLLGVVALIAVQLRKGGFRPRLDLAPQLYLPALALILVGSGLFLVVERYLDINTLSASLFGLASYGLLGLWMNPQTWRQGLPAALLLIGALPFGEHMQTFVGYPVRILTARIVSDGLAALGVHSVGVDTILVFENGVSQVDLPCSGVKSLWTGGLFLLAATWVERRPINLRWLLIAAAFALFLLAANLARVAALITVGQVAGWRLFAEMLHVPLGVLGFAGACAAAVLLLRWAIPPRPEDETLELRDASALSRPAWLAPLLAGLVLVMSLFYAPRQDVALAQAPPTWELPAGMVAEEWPLSPAELEWLSQDGAVSASRWRFQWRQESGSLLVVASNTWRAHHRPERCFEVYGLSVDHSFSHLVAPDFPVRLLSLGGGGLHDRISAAYWLQSKGFATDDYASRIWADLEPQRQRWVLVTIVFDEAVDPRSADSQALYAALRQSLERGLEGGILP